jgi:hypothetical protein
MCSGLLIFIDKLWGFGSPIMHAMALRSYTAFMAAIII